MARRSAGIFVVTCVLLLTAAAPVAAAGGSARNQSTLDASAFASGTTNVETILHVPEVARYAVVAATKLGATLELVDRMAGTIAASTVDATTQRASGRADAFLEPGDYKVRVTKSKADAVTLSARRFSVTNSGQDDYDVPELLEGRSVVGTLGDLEIISYWVRVDADSPTLRVEMQGRCLSDAALWKDGVLETGVRPVSRTMERQKGRPLTVLELNAQVEPGTYLLICSGGPALAWSDDAKDQPFSIKRGAPYLGEIGITNVTFDARGSESFLVSARASYFELEAANNKGYRMFVSPDQPGQSRYASGPQAEITDKSTSYRISARSGGTGSRQWVTIQGPPGETVELRWLADTYSDSYGYSSQRLSGKNARDYLVTALGAAEGEESVDATGFAVDITTQNRTVSVDPKGIQTLILSGNQSIRRRVNALQPLSFIVEVDSAGYYAVSEKSPDTVTAKYSFQLLDDAITHGGAAPVELRNNGRAKLLNKLYVVTIQPVKAGILDFAIFPTTIVGGGSAAGLFAAQPPVPENGLFWPDITILDSPSAETRVLVGVRQGIPFGVSFRELPVNLDEPVCVRIDAAGSVTVPFRNTKEVQVFSTNPAFDASSVQIDGFPWRADRVLAPGIHNLVVSSQAKTPVWYVIGAVPPARPADQKPKRVQLEQLYPSFSQSTPMWRSFDRGESAIFLLNVTDPASYRVTTAGRLAMGIELRTPLRPGLFSVQTNADGRNAAITAYLRSGTYLVRVQTLGQSKGRAGVLLRRLDVTEAGLLADGVVLRKTVPADAVLKADVRIDHDATYALECLGLGRSFSYRFEDGDGWPIGQPVSDGTLNRDLAAGTYHYVSAADGIQTRRLLSLQLIPAAQTSADERAKLVSMEFNKTYHKVWMEAQGRPEDVFRLASPAEIHASLYLSDGMSYRVLDATGQPIAGGLGGQPADVVLTKGSYEIRVKSIEENNLKPYQIALQTADLYDGEAMSVAGLPQRVPVAVGVEGSVEIWSYGASEVAATLSDEAGNVILDGQAIPDDWNFRLVTALKPGRYSLDLSVPGGTVEGAPVEATDNGEGGQASMEQEDQTSVQDQNSDDQGDDTEGEADNGESSDQEAPATQEAQPAVQVPELGQPVSSAMIVRMFSRQTLPLSEAKGSVETSVDIGSEVAAIAFSPSKTGVYGISAECDEPVSASVSRGGNLVASGATPLLLPLAGDSSYDLRLWHSGTDKKHVAIHVTALPAAEASLTDAGMSLSVKESALHLSNPAGGSFSVGPADAGALRYSPGVDAPFVPLTDAAVNTVAGSGWVIRGDGGPVGSVTASPFVLADGVGRAFMIGVTSQVFSVSVPQKTVAIVRTENSGRTVGISAAPVSSFKPAAYDWSGSAVSPTTSVTGLRDGSFRGKLWDAAPGASAENRRTVAARFYPVSTEAQLPKAGRLELNVPPSSAVNIQAGGLSAVRVSLERGMTAFAWNAKPEGVLDAADDDVTGVVQTSSGQLTVVNSTAHTALCSLEAAASAAGIALGDGYESVLAAARNLSLAASTDRSLSVFVWGGVSDARFFSEDDGHIYDGTAQNTTFGPVLKFPGGTGRFEISAQGGPLRVWAAKPDAMQAGFVSRDASARSAALPQEGAVLTSPAQTWNFSLDQDSIVCVTTDADGVSALFTSGGELKAVAAGMGGRTLLASLSKGAYGVFTRPFKGAGQNGTLRQTALKAVPLDHDGEGQATLIGPGDMRLYSFTVKAPGNVGAGIKVERDGLVATLYDAQFVPIVSGTIFIRELPVGAYYMLVRSKADTQRFTPVVYGLSGSRTETPPDIIQSYEQAAESQQQ